MSVRTKIAKNATPHLHPHEQVEAVLVGQTRKHLWLVVGAVLTVVGALVSPLLQGLSALVLLWFLVMNRYRSIVITDRRMLVLDSGRLAGRARKVVAELPRGTVLGPWRGGRWETVELAGDTLHIHQKFRAEVDAQRPAFARARS